MRFLPRRTRSRLTAVFACAFTVVAVVGAVVFWLAFSAAELHAVDSGLRAQAQVVRAGLRLVGSAVSFEGRSTLPGETARGVATAAVLLDPSGRVLAESDKAPPSSDLRTLVATSTSDATTPITARLGGRDDRVLIDPLWTDGRRATLVLARSLEEYSDTMKRTAIFLVVTVATLIIVASLSGYVLAGRVLKPVRMIAATARDLSEHDLHRRITLNLPPDELGELAATFNGMLARLEAAFESLQRFTADAAHELRTPLALMRTEVQFTLRGSQDIAEYRAALESVLKEVEDLTRTAEQLMLLARADAGTLTPRLEPVDVDELLEEAAMRWHSTLDERGVRLTLGVSAAPTISADGALLRRVLDNLIDNAARHTPRGGTINLHGGGCQDGLELLVRDTGAGVDPVIRERLFERFTRSDPARGRETGGAGLGLSICAAIVRLHGGTIHLERGTDPGACFRVWLPPHPSRSAAAIAEPIQVST